MPNTIIVFRDGLSDDELDMAVRMELPQISEVCADPTVIMEFLHSGESSSESGDSTGSRTGKLEDFAEMDYRPEIYFIVVQKRINQRLFALEVR